MQQPNSQRTRQSGFWIYLLNSDNLAPIKKSAEFISKIVAENSAKKTCPFCLNLSFLSENAQFQTKMRHSL